MKYRTLELIGSLVLAGVAAAMFTKAHANPVEDCVKYAEFARQVDIEFDRGTALSTVLGDIASVPGNPNIRRVLINMAVTGYEYHRVITPNEAYALTFDVCMRGLK